MEHQKTRRHREKVQQTRVSAELLTETDIDSGDGMYSPVEVTSKRPVTRKRQVVEVPKLVSSVSVTDKTRVNDVS